MTPSSILLVEDDRELGPTLHELLHYFDLNPQLVTNGNDVHDALARFDPGVMLLDLHIPGRSGIELLREIRSNLRYATLKIIVLTADRFVRRELLNRADAILLKPFTVDALTDAIDAVLNSEPDPDEYPMVMASGF